jgi:transcriptional regulator with XRE-family HTH domain
MSAETTTAVGAMVRELRQERGLSLRDLSRASGLSVTTILNIETGVGNAALTSLTALAEGLGCTCSIVMEPVEVSS